MLSPPFSGGIANPGYPIVEAADSKMSGMTLVDASEDAPVLLDLALEEDIAANLDHYILLSRQGFFEDANSFFEACLEKRASWFPIIWEYYNCQTIKNPYFDPVADRFLIQASRSYMQDSEERVLLDLIVNGVRRLDYSIKCLRGSVRAEVIRDIDVCITIASIAHDHSLTNIRS